MQTINVSLYFSLPSGREKYSFFYQVVTEGGDEYACCYNDLVIQRMP